MLIKPEIVPASRFIDKRGQLVKFDTSYEEYVAVNFTNVFRGMHMTEGQEKIVTCLKGRIIDYVVDARKKSDTFGKLYIFSLSEEMGSLHIPAGFLHGYYSPCLSVVHYAMDTDFDPDRYVTVKAESIKGIPIMGCFIRSKKDEEAMTLEEYKEMT